MDTIETWDDLGAILQIAIKNKVHYTNTSKGTNFQYSKGGAITESDCADFLNAIGKSELLRRIQFVQTTQGESARVQTHSTPVQDLNFFELRVQELETALNSKVQESSKVELRVQELNLELNSERSKVQELNSEVQKLNSKVQESSKEVELLNSKVQRSSKIELESSKVQTEFKKVQTELNEFNRMVSHLRNQLNIKDLQIENEAKTVLGLKNQLQEKVQLIKSLESVGGDAATQKTEIAVLRKDLQFRDEKIEVLQNDLRLLQSGAGQKDSALNDVIRDLDEWKKRTNETNEKLNAERLKAATLEKAKLDALGKLKVAENRNNELEQTRKAEVEKVESVGFRFDGTFKMTVAMTIISIIVMGFAEFQFLKAQFNQLNFWIAIVLSGAIVVLYQCKFFDFIGDSIALNWLMESKTTLTETETDKKANRVMSQSNWLYACFAIYLAFGTIAHLSIEIINPVKTVDDVEFSTKSNLITRDSAIVAQKYATVARLFSDSIANAIGETKLKASKIVGDWAAQQKVFNDTLRIQSLRNIRLNRIETDFQAKMSAITDRRNQLLSNIPMKAGDSIAFLILPIYVFLLIFRMNGFRVNAVKKQKGIELQSVPLVDTVVNAWDAILKMIYVKKPANES